MTTTLTTDQPIKCNMYIKNLFSIANCLSNKETRAEKKTFETCLLFWKGFAEWLSHVLLRFLVWSSLE